jgi:hypothetical protein
MTTSQHYAAAAASLSVCFGKANVFECLQVNKGNQEDCSFLYENLQQY